MDLLRDSDSGHIVCDTAQVDEDVLQYAHVTPFVLQATEYQPRLITASTSSSLTIMRRSADGSTSSRISSAASEPL